MKVLDKGGVEYPLRAECVCCGSNVELEHTDTIVRDYCPKGYEYIQELHIWECPICEYENEIEGRRKENPEYIATRDKEVIRLLKDFRK